LHLFEVSYLVNSRQHVDVDTEAAVLQHPDSTGHQDSTHRGPGPKAAAPRAAWQWEVRVSSDGLGAEGDSPTVRRSRRALSTALATAARLSRAPWLSATHTQKVLAEGLYRSYGRETKQSKNKKLSCR